MKQIVLSNSSKTMFAGCKRKWFFYHREGLRPKIEKQALWIGSLWHEFLDVLYSSSITEIEEELKNPINFENAYNHLENLLDEKISEILDTDPEADEDKLGKNRVLLLNMARDYKYIYLKDIQEKDFLETEIPFRIGIRKRKIKNEWKQVIPGFDIRLLGIDEEDNKYPVNFTGVIDATLLQDGKFFIMEHKTTKDSPSLFENNMRYTGQPYGYILAGLLMSMQDDISKVGMIYNITKKSYYKEPKTTQCRKCKGTGEKKGAKCDACNGTGVGGISKVAIETSYNVFKNILDKYPHINPTEYSERLDRLKKVSDTLHGRFTFYASKKEIKEWLEELWEQATEIRQYEKKNKTKHYRTMSFLCNMCQYRDLCAYDNEELRANNFQIVNISNLPDEVKSKLSEEKDEKEQLF